MAPSVVQPPVARQPSPFPDPIPGIISFGSINMLAGATGVGKTAMTAEWCARFRDGRTICNKPTNKPTGIGIITGDRRWSDHQKWFDKAGYGDIPHYSLRDDPALNWETAFLSRGQTVKTLERALDVLKLPPGGLLYIDPMALFICGNVNDYKTSAIGIGVIDHKVLKHRQLTTIGMAHMGKQKNDQEGQYTRPQDRILGSTALLAFSDTPMYLLGPETGDPEGEYEFGWTPHHAPAESFLFRRDKQGLFIPYYDLDGQKETKTVLEAIPHSDEGIAVNELVDALQESHGFSRAKTYRHLKALEGQGYITRPHGKVIRRKIS